MNTDATKMSRTQQKLLVMGAFAHDLSKLSTCKAQQCGCVAFPTDFSAVFAVGYNGPAMGLPNDGCTAPDLQQGELARCGCVHAEANLLVRMGKEGEPAILLCTHAPCPHCAGLIINCHKVAGVIYRAEYWTDRGKQMLTQAGIATLLYGPLLYEGMDVKFAIKMTLDSWAKRRTR